MLIFFDDNVLSKGLEKLLEAGKSVAQLSDELVVKEHDLELATVEVDKVDFKTLN